MQMTVRDEKLFVWWSIYVIGWWFLAGVGCIVAGVIGKIDLRLGLVLGGTFGLWGVYQWHRLSVWRRQRKQQTAALQRSKI